MKKIEAIIRPEKIDDVCQALEKAGCRGMMISEIEGYGKQRGVLQQWRGEKYRINFLPKIKIDIVLCDSEVEKIVQVILENARTGEIGDGKIFISDIKEVIRIRTGEKGEICL